MLRLLFITGFILITSSCARVGQPTGGEKDTTPPKVIFTRPANQSVNFKGNEIIIQFDEYVTIKDIQKNLLISPPPQQMPVLIPNNFASKKFVLKFQNALQPQTTYSINFGESISDYNENNRLKNYQLVFSTGSQIDSLQFKGKAVTVYETDKPEKIILGLYPVENFKDSLVFTEKPYYVTVAGKNGDFTFTHLKQGRYKLIAIGDKNNDYKYKQGKELIGFLSRDIHIPGDSGVVIRLFRESLRPSIEKINQLSANHIQINFKGDPDSLIVKSTTPVSKETYIKKYNVYNYWYDSRKDSIGLLVQLNNKKKKYHKKRSLEKDSLVLHLSSRIRLNPTDTLHLKTNMPALKLERDKIILLKDSLPVSFQNMLNKERRFDLFFEKLPGKTYQLTLLPGSITGFNGEKLKDTVRSVINIPKLESFGNLIITLQNTYSAPLFIELLRDKKIIRKTPTSTGKVFELKYLKPGSYTLRLVFDPNNNNRWDKGNYLQHIQAEKTFEPENEIEIRANWDVHQQYDLKSIAEPEKIKP
jgi:uncharacterized protein (DUF2141 family)